MEKLSGNFDRFPNFRSWLGDVIINWFSAAANISKIDFKLSSSSRRIH